ncbi:hypothetical protein THIOSC13_420007 [uncultured Thiomicrorhabdus sp.]
MTQQEELKRLREICDLAEKVISGSDHLDKSPTAKYKQQLRLAIYEFKNDI